MNLKEIYKAQNALLEGHFLLSSGKHSQFYLQSAKVLEDPKIASLLAKELANQIKNANIKIDTVCSPALGGILAGYELARALEVRFIFTERVDKKMTLRRGFEVENGENIIICEDIITTGGSALEASNVVEAKGAKVVAYTALANRGFCKRVNSKTNSKSQCKLPKNIPFFAIDDIEFEMYEANNCPFCLNGSKAIKPGSRGN